MTKTLRYGISTAAFLAFISVAAQAEDLTTSSAAQVAQTPAKSQGADADAAAPEEVFVTAQKRREKIQDVPISISAFTPQEIQKMNLKTTEDLAMRTPGFNLNLEFEYAQTYIRGIGENYTNPGLEPSVAVYQDGVYDESAFALVPLFDMKSVEVLKGPQGTLYGRNATGGAILLETQDPQDTFGGRLYTSYGNYNHLRNEAVLNLPITDTLKIRVAGLTEQQDGYIRNELDNAPLGDNAGHKELFRGKVEWTPTDWLDIVNGLEFYDNWQKAPPHQELLPFGSCAYCVQYNVQPPTGFYHSNQNISDSDNQRNISDNLHVSVHLEDYDIVSVTGYRSLRVQDRSDQDFTAFNLYNLLGQSHDLNYYEELRFSSKYSGPINFMSGLVAERDQASFPYNYGIPGFGLPNLNNRTDSHIDAYSGYLEGYYNFLENFKLTVGGRYSFDRKILDTQNSPLAAAVFGDSEYHAHQSFYNFTPRVVLAYNNDWGNFYINYQKGFKSGGYNTPAFTSENVLGPEKIESVEVGAKNSFFDKRLRTNTSVFHYSTDGLQVQQTNVAGGNLTSYQNAATSESWGVDFDTEFALTSKLKLGAGVEYLHARFTEFRNASVLVPVPGTLFLANSAEDLANHVTPHSPAYNGFFSVTYADNYDGWDGQVSLIANGTTSYEFNTGAGGPLRLDRQNSYATANFTAFLAPPELPVRFGFYINNLSDTRYNEVVTTNAGSSFHSAALPLTFGGSIEYDFDENSFGSPATPAATPAPPPPAPEPAPPAPPAPQPEAQRAFQVFFDFDKSAITDAAAGVIQQAAAAIKSGHQTRIMVTGHTDTVGSMRYNQKLSERRAAAVKQQLIADGIGSEEIATRGVGKTDLLVPTPDGVREPQNRRAEIVEQ